MYRNTTVGSLPLGLSRRLLAQCSLPLRLPDWPSAAWRCLAACRFMPRAPAAAASREPSPIQTALVVAQGAGHRHQYRYRGCDTTLKPPTRDLYSISAVAGRHLQRRGRRQGLPKAAAGERHRRQRLDVRVESEAHGRRPRTPPSRLRTLRRSSIPPMPRWAEPSKMSSIRSFRSP